jgi:23S rRNA (uracil1939-C5)-methyltransferase
MLHVRDRITVALEKPAAGGWMIGRHEGQVVLVSGAIPGERVAAVVTRAERSVAYATAVDIIEPSPDRRAWAGDWTCGGATYAFIDYSRQLTLKAEVVADAFARIARLPLSTPVEMAASEERGYRMRARLHVHDGAIGFFRETTHDLCDPSSTGQLTPETCGVIDQIRLKLKSLRLQNVSAIELAENADLSERVIHLQLRPGSGVKTSAYAPIAGTRGLTGLTCALSTGAATVRLGGEPFVHDTIQTNGGTSRQARPNDAKASYYTLRRHVRSFFQGNRYLLQTLVDAVRAAVGASPDEEVLDLYSGVGLFAVALAAAGWLRVTAVEGDRSSADDLVANARPFEDRLTAHAGPVEAYVRGRSVSTPGAIVVDPPRTGLSREASEAILAVAPRQLVYVSCDVATLARDARRIVDSGYELTSVRGFDLFPNTPHVETLAAFSRVQPGRRRGGRGADA